jgi:hypothetical protein
MPESEYFKQQKSKGRWFEGECEKVMLEKGMEVIDSEKLKYKEKKGWDREAIVNGQRCKIEIKYDALSEQTGNVFLELASLNQSTSPIWLYGLPEGEMIPTYSMFLSELKPFAEQYPKKIQGGEFNGLGALVPKNEFVRLPFVYKFKTLSVLPF